MSQTKYVAELAGFYEILLDDKLDNLNIQFINDNMVQMTYNFKDQFVNNSKNTKIFYTTSWTTYREKSCILIPIANYGTKQIETADMLGDMTDELSGKGITNFVSTGPKS